MATEAQKRELIRITSAYTNAQSNGNTKAVKLLAKQLADIKKSMK